MIKIFKYIVMSSMLISIIFLSSQYSNINNSNVHNNNLDKYISFSKRTKMTKKVDEFNYNNIYGAINTYVGDLTGYVYNCPLCTGRLACLSNLDLSGGLTTYHDDVYGDVRIVASSKNLSCGTIIRFNSDKLSSEPIFAIVLDRGVTGNAIDLLVESNDYAIKNVGRSLITYDVLRNGW